jgi:predicted 3-demethylubiquinone-9 3-methyltransferase (glyoxalase superfamily)
MKNPIYPCIWFNANAKEAAKFYTGVFKDSHVISDSPLAVLLGISGQNLMLLNGGPEFTPNPSVSLYTLFDDEKELNEAWDKLIIGGFAMMALDMYPWSNRYGWLQDKYGISWQLSLRKHEGFNQKISPALMFTGEHSGKAREAISLYTALFPSSGIIVVNEYDEKDPDITGTVKHAQFRLFDRVFIAMDSSFPHPFAFNEGISFVVECDDQAEIDFFWEKLTEGGEESQCGWLKDRYGVSWQIIPAILRDLISDPERSQRVVQAFLKMKKFDISKLISA